MMRPLPRHIIFALGLAVLVFIVDQANKLLFLQYFGLATGQRQPVLPFFDIVMVWNYGISYGLFQQHSQIGQLILVAVKLGIAGLLVFWLLREERPATAYGLGLILGGAAGNVLDRLLYGAVADFYLLHWGDFQWYVFNLADVAIVAGALLLVYTTFIPPKKKEAL